ncbi:hypothetical protein ACLKA6_016210 [Drosophila palustris]
MDFVANLSRFQNMPTVKLSNKVFEKRFKFDWSNERYMRKVFTDDVIKEMTDSSDAIQELEGEWEKLVTDRDNLRTIFPNGDSKVVLPCNLQRMIWNVQKIFHINKRLPTDLSPMRVIRGVQGLLEDASLSRATIASRSRQMKMPPYCSNV